MRIVFIGSPGSGKGTQALRLADWLGVPHLSTGDLLRAAIEAQTPLGKAARSYMDAGELVPDAMVVEMVDERLKAPDCRDGCVFDGFPRTLFQAESLDQRLVAHGTSLGAALELQVNDEELLRRLAGRGRSDDELQVVLQRLAVFHKQTEPLAEYYRRRGLLRTVDGIGTPAEVCQRVRSAVEQLSTG